MTPGFTSFFPRVIPEPSATADGSFVFMSKGAIMKYDVDCAETGEKQVMELFLVVPDMYFCRCQAEQNGIRDPSIMPGGLREACPMKVNIKAGDGQLDPAFVASFDSDPFESVARGEALHLCDFILKGLNPAQRAVLQACFFDDDEQLACFGLDPKEVKPKVTQILLRLRAVLSSMFAPGDVF